MAVPIRPELRPLYPPHWREVSMRVRPERARGRCQGSGVHTSSSCAACLTDAGSTRLLVPGGTDKYAPHVGRTSSRPRTAAKRAWCSSRLTSIATPETTAWPTCAPSARDVTCCTIGSTTLRNGGSPIAYGMPWVNFFLDD